MSITIHDRTEKISRDTKIDIFDIDTETFPIKYKDVIYLYIEEEERYVGICEDEVFTFKNNDRSYSKEHASFIGMYESEVVYNVHLNISVS